MYSVEGGLIGSGHGGMPRGITIRNKTFHTSFNKVLVVRKSKIQCIDIGMFGDGMELIQIQSNPFMMQQIRNELLVQALQIYTEYNEKENKHIAYAYHFPKDDDLIQEINTLLPSGTLLSIEDRFVKVLSDQEPTDCDGLIMLLKHNGKRGIISYLYGLSLLYGTWVGEGGGMEIRFPFGGSVVSYDPCFEYIKSRLQTQGYDVEWKIINADVGQSCSIYIHDWCILEQFAVWQGVEGPLPGRERVERYKSKVLEYLKMEHTPGNTMQTIANGLLKLRKK